MAFGPSGWTRTTTTRVKSPACCVDTTEGSESDPVAHRSSAASAVALRRSRTLGAACSRHGAQAGAGSDQRLERMAGFEPAPQGLEGPQATVTPHSLWSSLGLHPGWTRTGVVHRPIDIRQLSKIPLLRARPLDCVATASRLFEDTTAL